MKDIKIIVTFLIVFLLFNTFAECGETEARKIVYKSVLAYHYQAKDGRAKVKMTITDKRGRKRFREFVLLRKTLEDGGKQLFYAYFKRPIDVNGMAFLVKKHPGSDDDRWLYMPSLDLVKRISSVDKRTSFVGSNMFYEDVSGRDVQEDTHQLLEENAEGYLIKSIPKDLKNVEFEFYTLLVDKKTFLPLKYEYYDKHGAIARVIEAMEIETVDSYPTVTKLKTTDNIKNSHTVTEFRKISYNLGLSNKIFTERYLRKIPKEVKL